MGIAQQFTCREPNDHFRRLPPPLVQQVVLGGVAKCVTGTTDKIMYGRDNMSAADTPLGMERTMDQKPQRLSKHIMHPGR